MRKYLNIAYIMPLLVVLIFILGICACDNPFLGKPDIRDEYNQGEEKGKPDYFGWKWRGDF